MSHLSDCKMYLSAIISMRESPAPTHFCVELVGEHVRPRPLVLTRVQPKFVQHPSSPACFTGTHSP